jgi:hypothetical protein
VQIHKLQISVLKAEHATPKDYMRELSLAEINCSELSFAIATCHQLSPPSITIIHHRSFAGVEYQPPATILRITFKVARLGRTS